MPQSSNDNNGRHLLAEKDFVAVVEEINGEEVEVGAVPKHWDASLIPAGRKKTNRKPKGQTARTAAEPPAETVNAAVKKAVDEAREKDAARIAELEKQLAEAKKS